MVGFETVAAGGDYFADKIDLGGDVLMEVVADMCQNYDTTGGVDGVKDGFKIEELFFGGTLCSGEAGVNGLMVGVEVGAAALFVHEAADGKKGGDW